MEKFQITPSLRESGYLPSAYNTQQRPYYTLQSVYWVPPSANVTRQLMWWETTLCWVLFCWALGKQFTKCPKDPQQNLNQKKYETNGKKINLGRAPPASAHPSPSQDASHNIFHAKSARYRGQHDSNRWPPLTRTILNQVKIACLGP